MQSLPNVVMNRLSEVQDSDDDQDRITLSLGILDGQLSEEEEYSEQPSNRDRKSNNTQRSPTPKTARRTPTPRRSSRASTRASTRGSEHLQACTSRTRSRTPSRRARARRSPSYSPPRIIRVSSPEERVGAKHTIKLETHRIVKFTTGEGTHRANVTFNPRLAPPRRRQGLTPAQQSFLSHQQGVSIANFCNPESQIISIFNAPPSLKISIMNYQVHN